MTVAAPSLPWASVSAVYPERSANTNVTSLAPAITPNLQRKAQPRRHPIVAGEARVLGHKADLAARSNHLLAQRLPELDRPHRAAAQHARRLHADLHHAAVPAHDPD